MDDVIGELATWNREPILDGIALMAPASDVRVRIRPRVRSWMRLADVLDAAIDDARSRTGRCLRVSRHPIARLRTAEGEPAGLACADVVGTLESLRVTVAIAGVDPFGCVDALGPPSTLAFVERLIQSLPLGLGSARTRPFEYRPPPRWIGLRRDRRTVWLHPAYPSVRACMTMFDAHPFGDARKQQLARRLLTELRGTLDSARVSPPEDLALDAGLVGRTLLVEGSLDGRHVARCAATAADDRYLYAAHYEGPIDVVPTFRDVFVSLQPLPVTP